jgi:hypothetical protein
VVVLVLFTHTSQGLAAARTVLNGVLLGLYSPAVFFSVLALTMPRTGLLGGFVAATGAALLAQGLSMLTATWRRSRLGTARQP